MRDVAKPSKSHHCSFAPCSRLSLLKAQFQTLGALCLIPPCLPVLANGNLTRLLLFKPGTGMFPHCPTALSSCLD